MKHERFPMPALRQPVAPVLNIGLATRDGGSITAKQALDVLRWQLGRTVLDWTVAQSATEPTLVAEIDAKLSPLEGEHLAERLRQDCVAQFDGFNGQLYGPNAEAWGPFNPAYFLLFDGLPLERLEVAA